MKTLNKFFGILIVLGLSATSTLMAQQPDLQFFRTNDAKGLNVFETTKADTVPFDGLKVRVGGDFAIEFQGINQTNSLDSLLDLGTNLNLPTANLNLDVQLSDGMRMHLRTYLSARHHNESWVKGGYIQIDKLDFIKPDFAANLMKVVTFRVGLDEVNFGDAHFRRTDNARAIFNPFVGNYIMDSFTTEAFIEANAQSNGFIGVLGISNGKLNQSVVVTPTTDNKISFYGKLGYDKQFNDDLRFRITGSWYMNSGLSTGAYLYGGDRAGDRYYNTLISLAEAASGVNATSAAFNARFNPRFKQMTAIQINPFLKYQGLELFGIYEIVSNSKDQGSGSYTQTAVEAIYRIGAAEKVFIGGRYNSVSGKATDAATATQKINRINLGGGWFMTDNVVAKLEYVNQQYTEGWTGKYNDAEFKGIMIEAAISF
jgi:hypothetical protein